LFGNIYEGVVKIPERLATDPNRTSVLGPGSRLLDSGLAITGYLVRRVNLKVMFAASPPPQAEQDALIEVWYRLNLVRIAAASAALFAAYRANAAIAKLPA
jgi:hypothetical protein